MHRILVPYSRFFVTCVGLYGAQRDHHSIDFNPVQRRFTAILYGASRESLIPFNALKTLSVPQTNGPQTLWSLPRKVVNWGVRRKRGAVETTSLA